MNKIRATNLIILLYNANTEKIYHKSKFYEKTLEIFNTCVHKFIIPLLIYKKLFHIIKVR